MVSPKNNRRYRTDSPSKFHIQFPIFVSAFAVAVFFALTATSAYAATKEEEIAELDRKIKELAAQHEEVQGEVAATQAQVKQLQNKLEAARLELRRTKTTIEQVEEDQVTTGEQIKELEVRVAEKREHLRGLLRLLYEEEQQSLIRLFFDTFSLSQVLAQREVLEQLQGKVTEAAHAMRQETETLENEQEALRSQQQNLVQLQGVLLVQEEEVAVQEEAESAVLAEQTSEAATVASELADAKQAREEIARKVFTVKTSGEEISLNNAFDMARYGSKLTGVRPALLLAVIKVESNLGANVGGGRYPNDMQPASREAFVRITDKLGLDRATAPVARRPASGSGWGGAMGPAQIMPATWETLEPRLEQLMGKSPVNPYELADAFVATAIYLADRGAAGGDERGALARYVAGPYWQYHINGWYVERVLAVAVEYEKELAK